MFGGGFNYSKTSIIDASEIESNAVGLLCGVHLVPEVLMYQSRATGKKMSTAELQAFIPYLGMMRSWHTHTRTRMHIYTKRDR